MLPRNLAAGDPLSLNLGADVRLTQTDYSDDQTWELSLSGGEPAALAFETTYGLRAQRVRLFPRFISGDTQRCDPAGFHQPPRVLCCYPNYLALTFEPFEGLEALAEYWIPESQVAAGRLRLNNYSILPLTFRLEWTALLIPRDRQGSLAPVNLGTVQALCGETANLQPAIYLSGGPRSAAGPYPALALDLEMYPGNLRLFTWAAAGLRDKDQAIDTARRTTLRSWDAEITRMELLNRSQMVKITTGDEDWDVAFALAQKTAFELFLHNRTHLPHPSFVLTRRPDLGYSPRGDGIDHPLPWTGQTALDAYYLAGLLPGAPQLSAGVLRNFLAVQDENGNIDWRPGMGGQRTRRLAQPLLAALAVRLAPHLQTGPENWTGAALETPAPETQNVVDAGDEAAMTNEPLAAQALPAEGLPDEAVEAPPTPAGLEWYREVYPGLLRFFNAWMSPAHDADGDGYPEWENGLQTGLDDSPLYDRFSTAGRGLDAAQLESPALAAMLYRECRSLIHMAQALHADADLPGLHTAAERLQSGLESCWDARAGLYQYRDYASHLSLPGMSVVSFQGSGSFSTRRRFKQPRRLVLRLEVVEERTYAAVFTIHGYTPDGESSEVLAPRSFSWLGTQAYASSQQTFLAIERVEVQGVGPRDKVRIFAPDTTQEDCSLLLPLWAGVPSNENARRLVESNLLGRFRKRYGIPIAPGKVDSVSLPWNSLLGEGLMRYGYRKEAADLVERCMSAILPTLKQQRTFRQNYHAGNAQPGGERGHLHGLPPLGLFLQVLGIQHLDDHQIFLDGFSPLTSPVTVQYRKVNIVCHPGRTEISFPGGQNIIMDRPGPHHIFLTRGGTRE